MIKSLRMFLPTPVATVRGSGTNGYVQKNLSFVSATRAAERKDRSEGAN